MTAPSDPLIWLRSLCESLPGVEEVSAWGHPNFRVAGRVFATFEVQRGRPSIAVKMALEEQDLLIEQGGFFKTPYAGKQGWVSAWVDQPVRWELLLDLVTQAHAAAAMTPARQVRPARPQKPA
jgi:predicted DNA-binding protein (MmcQ/YjbR family)